MFTQRLRYVVPVFITVPGDMTTSFEVGDYYTEVERARYHDHSGCAENTGDVRVRPEGTVDVLDPIGKLLVSFPVKMESIYAQTARRSPWEQQERFHFWTLPGAVNLADPDTGKRRAGNSRISSSDTMRRTPVPVLISITSATATPKPAADNVQFVQVEATIQNSGDPVANAQLSLVASKDGAEVERFPISQSLSLPTGDTPISTRYLPADGWTTGTWTFELLLESVDPSGAAVVLGRLPVDGTVTIP